MTCSACISYHNHPKSCWLNLSCSMYDCDMQGDMNENKVEEDHDDDDADKAFLHHCLCFFELERLIYVVYVSCSP